VAVCLIDSGVDLNPDTAPLMAERISLDGGSGDDVLPSSHGTQMAMVMGAPANGWGMVGIWPHIKIVSVRATPEGQGGFEFPAYRKALESCRLRGPKDNIAVAELALGGSRSVSAQEQAELRDMIEVSRSAGLSVVAAAGNTGGEVEAPASFPPVVAVAAGGEGDVLCPFASRGAAVDIVAPGCHVDQAWLQDGSTAVGQGSSQASAVVAVVMAALRAYRPDLGPVEAERLVTAHGRPTPTGVSVDAERTFRAAGLGSLVDEAPVTSDNQPRESHVGPEPRTDLPVVSEPRLPKPKLARLRSRRGVLDLTVRTRPRRALMVVSVHRRSLKTMACVGPGALA